MSKYSGSPTSECLNNIWKAEIEVIGNSAAGSLLLVKMLAKKPSARPGI
jgi:hypothetical protein